MYNLRTVLTSYFDVSKLQKPFPKTTQIYLHQSANFGRLFLIACVTISHNVTFNNINCYKWHELQQIETNTQMKHRSKPFTAILSKHHVRTRKVCFAMGRIVSMLSIYELMTKFYVLWAKLVQLYSNRPVLTSQFDVSKLQQHFKSVIQIHSD